MDYYAIAGTASREIGRHAGLQYIKRASNRAKKILDVGCGEGSRLETLLPIGKSGWGIDASLQAIRLAKAHYPRHHFQTGFGEKLPFPDATFDLVYSAFVVEHCHTPQKFISEMIRVCQPGGLVVLLCPNYGAPNRRSPVSIEKPLPKLFHGFRADFTPDFRLNWTAVTPKKHYQQIDDDTTWEPYLYSLCKYLSKTNVQIISASSLWELEPFSLNPRKLTLKLLGSINLFPFKYWGPQIFVAAKVLVKVTFPP